MRKHRGKPGKRRERGAVLVEFVLILPVFLLLLFGGLDMAITVNGMGTFRSDVEQGVTFIQQGDTVPATDPCVATLTTATPTNTPAATLATAEALCEVNDSISSVAGVNLSTLQEALVCENQFSGIVDCTQTPAPAKFVVCARANAQSVTGLLSPILDGIWVSSVSAGTITGTASTMWNAPSYNSSAGSSNPVVCPPNPTYTVSFDPNGATGGTMLPQTADSSTALTANSFTYQGYTFAGWNTAANGSGTPYGDGATYPFTVSATLYAQWTLNPTYTVTFDPNGGSGTMSPENANSPTALNLNAFNPSPPDTTFTGWNTAQDGSGTAYPDGAIYPFTSSVTLYAQWS